MASTPRVGETLEQRLGDELELRRAIMDSLAEGVYAVDRQGRVTALNATGERLLGWTEDELRGRDAHETFHFQGEDGTPSPKDECPLLRVVHTGEVVRSSDDVFTRRDGSRFPVSYVSSPVLRE